MEIQEVNLEKPIEDGNNTMPEEELTKKLNYYYEMGLRLVIGGLEDKIKEMKFYEKKLF